MRAVVQRVSRASVTVEGAVRASITGGLVVLLAVAKGDTQRDAAYLVDKILGLRIFPDQAGKMNRSLLDAGGALLVVSQFTLYGDCRKGKRPSFDKAAPAREAEALYEYFVHMARHRGVAVQTGVFQADMDVELVNRGPVTLIVES